MPTDPLVFPTAPIMAMRNKCLNIARGYASARPRRRSMNDEALGIEYDALGQPFLRGDDPPGKKAQELRRDFEEQAAALLQAQRAYDAAIARAINAERAHEQLVGLLVSRGLAKLLSEVA